MLIPPSGDYIELDLSVCLVAGGGAKTLHGLLKTIHETADPVGVETLVAEVAESGAMALADEFPNLTVVRLLGLSRLAALNRLLSLSHGRYCALMDNDLLLQPGCLKRLIDFMDDNPDVALVSPRIKDLYGQTESACRAFPPLLRLSGIPFPVPPPHLQTATVEVDWCQTGIHLLRRELLEEIGPLDEGCADLADLDLYWRAKRQGWHSFYLFEAEAVHAQASRSQLGLDHPSPWPDRLMIGLRFLKKRLLA